MVHKYRGREKEWRQAWEKQYRAVPENQLLMNTTKKARRDLRKEQLLEYMGKSCKQCGGSFHPAAMDLHHIDPNSKEKNIAILLGGSWEKLKDEADKCILLCSNCHRTLHALETEKRYVRD